MSTDTDVVDLLLQQHGRIRAMFDRVEEAPTPEHQQVAFAELRRFLAVHETAEEMVVHPWVRGQGKDGVVDERLLEERQAKEVLSALDGMDVRDPAFDGQFRSLKALVLAHAVNEEKEEFPFLRDLADERKLALMAQAVRAAEAIAPTHPHPGVESATSNLVLGPIASVVDRTRDAISAVLDRPR